MSFSHTPRKINIEPENDGFGGGPYSQVLAVNLPGKWRTRHWKMSLVKPCNEHPKMSKTLEKIRLLVKRNSIGKNLTSLLATNLCNDWTTYHPPNLPPRARGLIAGHIKGNRWLLSPDHKALFLPRGKLTSHLFSGCLCPGSQPPSKWWFLLDDDKPLLL